VFGSAALENLCRKIDTATLNQLEEAALDIDGSKMSPVAASNSKVVCIARLLRPELRR
jgi:hypothetical protein